jgi:hypothetical protein
MQRAVAKEADMPHFSGRALAAAFMVAVWTLALLAEIGAFKSDVP